MYSKLPEHTYHAIHILMTITSYPIPQSLMVSYFTSNPQLTIAVRHGFVQCLEESESSKVIIKYKIIIILTTISRYYLYKKRN